MADIMRATTPINNRNIITPTKEHRDASALPFDFQDLSKIKTTNAQSEMLGQNNVLRENGSSATALFSMLRDPDVATSYLKNIFFLREIVGLMPLNNETQTEEMQQLLNRLILTPEEIPQEMINQENIATIFKGDLFDTLRKLLSANGKPVSENIAEKFNQIPLAQIKDGGELLKQNATQQTTQAQNSEQNQPAQTTQNTQNNQNAQNTQNAQNGQTQNNPVMTAQPMVEGFIAPKENLQTNQPQEQLQNQNSQVQTNGENQNVTQNQNAVLNQQNPDMPQQLNGLPLPQQTDGNGSVNQMPQNPQIPVNEQQNVTQEQINAQPKQYVVYENGVPVTKNAEETFVPWQNQNMQTQQAQNPALNNEQQQMPTNPNNVEVFQYEGNAPVKANADSAVDVAKLLENIKSENTESIVNPEKVVSQRDLQDSVINLLKAINSQQSRADVLDGVKNNLLYLKESFPETSEYATQLDDLSKILESLMAGKFPKSDYPQVKSQILNLLDSLQNSVLYDGEMDKTVGLAKYNLSRYNSNDNLVAEAFTKLLQNVPDKELQAKLTRDLVKYFETEPLREASYESKTMSALAEILEKQSENMEAKMLNADSIDKIVHGLLSSPSNFTPLLHYVIPVDNGQTQAMAEIWINPNGEEDVEGGANSGKKMTHMLVVFEIDGIGKFETELYAEDKNISLSVMCPPEYVSNYKGVNADIRRACESTGYRFKSIEISELKESRSLIDVFRSLPARRSGINVTI